MKKGIFAICDSEIDYVYRLVDYLESQISQRFQLHTFSSVNKLVDYCNNNSLEILLVSNQLLDSWIQQINIKNLIIMSEGTIKAEYQNYLTIYKYQSAQEMFRQIMLYYAQNEKEDKSNSELKYKENYNFIGFYSPWNEELQTLLAMSYGELSGMEKSTLYLNLKGYHGFSQIMQRSFQRDISDLFYYFKIKEEKFTNYFDSIICKTSNLEYIPPVENPMDLKEITLTEWLDMLNKISLMTKYETIILDISDEIDESLKLLEICNKIYVPIKESNYKGGKMEQFDKVLNAIDKQKIQMKIEKVSILKSSIEEAAFKIFSNKKEVE
ncbi:P-loop NTPase family protein [Anaerosacchariphilus polymeriproducens]|uniref:Uncharacterized protein n=1 Tax=Anaerosacchariphilus polymeriproducens TaxID=1812858 RepID=A0A371B014_9FIRM|nr:hypothetical protein [Anaerosacchariphilus polymeriproducens]RDU25070.1 hypothetical protein DWV06_00800 [Anaerosacchariphilus polymeriproducens]